MLLGLDWERVIYRPLLMLATTPVLLSDKVISNEIFTLPTKSVKKLVINLTATLEKGCGGVVSEHEKFINFIFFFFRID